MNIQYNGFIGIYNNVYPDKYCRHLINEFDRLEENGVGTNRWQSEKALAIEKNDHQIFLELDGHSTYDFENKNIIKIFFTRLQICFENYVEKFPLLKQSNIRASAMKMQRIPSGGGYHVWHCENDNGYMARRVLAYMLYLNTLEPHEAGETEFLYQQQRFKPTENQMILWPTAFTHTHRGNTVFGEKSKYIATGWFYYD